MGINSLEELVALSARVQAGEIPSDEELAEAIAFARQQRFAAVGRKPKAPKTPKERATKVPSLEELLVFPAEKEEA